MRHGPAYLQLGRLGTGTIKIPTVLGHELAGEIVEVGSNVNDFYVGDIVSVEGHLVCGRCRNCLAGRRYKCANTLGFGVNTNGGFAEYHGRADDKYLEA